MTKPSDLNERQRVLYDLLVRQYRMKPARALAAVAIRSAPVFIVDKTPKVIAPPWEFKDGWVLTCGKCGVSLATDCCDKGEAATAAVAAGWRAKEIVVRCPACRAALR